MDSFLTANPDICSNIAFYPWENSHHVVFSVSMDYRSNLETDVQLMTFLEQIEIVFMIIWEVIHVPISFSLVLQ